jgi:predicted RNA-binding protein (TIGR00451 family)
LYRKPTREEKTQINRALDRWGAFEAMAGKALLVHENDELKTVCLVPQELEATIVKMQPHLAGLAIGLLKKQFLPSMSGADLFARLGKKNMFYVTVNENAEKLVLYGRDVMGESIVEASEELKENDLVIILNTKNEAIGIGRTRFAGRSLLQKGKAAITTLADAGYYLRDEG